MTYLVWEIRLKWDFKFVGVAVEKLSRRAFLNDVSPMYWGIYSKMYAELLSQLGVKKNNNG